MTGPAPAANAARRPLLRRLRPAQALLVAFVVVVLVSIVVSQVSLRNADRTHEREARERVVELIEGFTRGDPEAIATLVGEESSAPPRLLTPAAARIAFGEHPTVEVLSQWTPENSPTQQVRVNIVTSAGTVPLTLGVTRDVTLGTVTYKVSSLYLPHLNDDLVSGPLEAGAALKVNGVDLPLTELEKQPLVFPGRLVIQAPRGAVLDSGTPAGKNLLEASLLGLVGGPDHRGVSVDVPLATEYSQDFVAAAREAVHAWATACTGTREQVPSDCLAGAADPWPPTPNATVRGTTWRVVPEESGERLKWLPTENKAAVDPTRVAVDRFPLGMRATAQWLDGATWRTLQGASRVYVSGELRLSAGRWIFTPGPRKEGS